MKGVSDWKTKEACRDFDTVEEHDTIIVDNINKNVKADDHLWHIGDFTMGGANSIWEFRKRIICKNIHIILGNHDHHIKNNRLLDNCHRVSPFSEQIISGPPDDNYTLVYAQDLFRSVHETFTRKFADVDFVMCHYAMRTWNNSWKDSIMLYGHSHGNLPEYQEFAQDKENPALYVKTGKLYKTMDVGVDSALMYLGDMRPFHSSEIFDIMAKRYSMGIDRKEDE